MTFPFRVSVSDFRRALPLLGLTLLFAGLIAAGHALTTAPRTSIAQMETAVRRNDFVQAWVPQPVRDFRPESWDLYQHFLLNVPFGILAGFGGVLAGIAFRGNVRRWAVAVFLSLAAGWALYTEWRQVALPDRSAGWDDLLANWAGLAAGFAVWSGGAFLFARFSRSRAAANGS